MARGRARHDARLASKLLRDMAATRTSHAARASATQPSHAARASATPPILEFRDSTTKGRAVFAARDVAAGTTLMREAPLVSMALPEVI